MKTRFVFLFAFLTIASIAAERSVSLTPLSVPNNFPLEYQKASKAVAAAVAKAGLNPNEYYVAIGANHSDGLLHFELWHRSALKQRDDPNILGDPSGKCRTVLYDPKGERVTKIYGWK